MSQASALTIDPAVGLVDYVFDFDGTGEVTFGGDDTLDITLATPSTLTVHVEDCCVVGDEFDFELNGSVVPWDTVTSGDGDPNGAAVIGASGPYFEALLTLTLGAGLHTFDLIQTAGTPGATFLNISPASPIPVPAGALLVAPLLGAGALRKWKRAS